LLHGGHYLIDILGGIGMFFVALCVAGDVARRLQRDQISSYAVTVAAPQGQ
jgi:membrane-associated phospholipid phosphatase